MQFVSLGDNLHEIYQSLFSGKGKKNIICLSTAEVALKVVKVKGSGPYLNLIK